MGPKCVARSGGGEGRGAGGLFEGEMAHGRCDGQSSMALEGSVGVWVGRVHGQGWEARCVRGPAVQAWRLGLAPNWGAGRWSPSSRRMGGPWGGAP